MTAGRIEPTTWGAVEVGNIVRDKSDRFHTVVNTERTWYQLKSIRDGVVRAIQKGATAAVDIYVPSEAEQLNLVEKELGARMLREIEEREHTKARILNWRVDPIGRSAQGLRDHIKLIHGGAYVDDLLGRWATAREKGDKVRTKDQLDELVGAHATMHENPGEWPMAYPHHHAPIGG